MGRPPRAPGAAELAARDPAGAVALAVVEQAVYDAGRGDATARAWVEQLRRDILAEAPPTRRRRWAGDSEGRA